MQAVHSDLKSQRIQIYCSNTFDSACTFTEIHKKLGILNTENVPPVSIRNSSFTKLVTENFNNLDDFDAVNPWPVIKATTAAYKMLHEYALTPYGAVIVKRILEDNVRTGIKRFEIRLDDNSTARAGTHWISLPSNFPLKEYFPGGEKIDPLAVIHHEFAHTRFFTGNTKPAMVSIEDERIAVINNSNPARMFNKYEPRYTYFNGKETINIITGEKRSGRWSVNMQDPRKFES